MNNNNINKSNTFEKYEKLLLKLNLITKQKNKINFEYNLIKQKIDEFETINLLCLDELIKIKSNKIYL